MERASARRPLWFAMALVVAVAMLVVPRTASADYAGFPDVTGEEWFVSEGWVDYVADHGLMSGKSDGTFAGAAKLTRSEVVTVLYRMAGSPSAAAGYFTDVDYTAFYGAPVHWARLTGVVSGYGGTNTFGPADDVTREQLAVMLANYASKMGLVDTSVPGNPLGEFSDGGSVSSWARDAVAWAIDRNIISGDLSQGSPRVNPQGAASRAELAKMIAVLHRDVMGGRGPVVENAGVWHFEDGYVAIDFPIAWKGVANGSSMGHVLGNFHTDFYMNGHYDMMLFRVDGMHGQNTYVSASPASSWWGAYAWQMARGQYAGDYTRAELETALRLVTGGALGIDDMGGAASEEEANAMVRECSSQVSFLVHVK